MRVWDWSPKMWVNGVNIVYRSHPLFLPEMKFGSRDDDDNNDGNYCKTKDFSGVKWKMKSISFTVQNTTCFVHKLPTQDE